jgi:hypothetical protein
MQRRFTWERGPFQTCPSCRQETFGILSGGGHTLQRRCTECRHSEGQTLPEIDKRVLYLDQNAFSFLFAVESGRRLPSGHENFCRDAYQRLRRIVLLQQAILPHSDIHLDETIVYHESEKLRSAYELIGGDVSLTNSRSVEMKQVCEFAAAYIAEREPTLNFSVDEVLQSERNTWLPDMHIGVLTDYEHFADGLRQTRDRGHADMQKLIAMWARERPKFDAVLSHELNQFGPVRAREFTRAIDAMVAAVDGNGAHLEFNTIHNYLLEEHAVLRRMFQEAGCDQNVAGREVLKFWHWERNREMPHNRISAYLFAALARRVVGGQRKVTRGFMNDVRAISTYAPYVDAMFIDQECAEMLREGRLRDDLHYKAQIFSFADPQAFIGYLQGIEAQATDGVRLISDLIYGRFE